MKNRKYFSGREPLLIILTLLCLLATACEKLNKLLDDVPVTGIVLNKSETTVLVGGTEQLAATVLPQDASNTTVFWSSTNSASASVTSRGLVTGVSAGTADIVAETEDGGFQATCRVTVSSSAVAVTGVALNKENTTIPFGGTEQLVATITPTNATNQNLTWSSNAPAIASVSAGGLVTGAGVGTAIITAATVDGGFSDTCGVAVSPIGTAAAPSITPNGGTLWDGQNVTFQSATEGATFKYTVDGSDPRTSPTAAAGTSAFISMPMMPATIKAVATKAGYADSDVTSSAPFVLASEIIFVSPAGAMVNPGTLQAPKFDLQDAIDTADSLYVTAHVKAAEGTYSISNTITMREGISLVGSYTPEFSSRNLGGGSSVIHDIRTTGSNTVIQCSGISQNTVIDGFRIFSADTDSNSACIGCDTGSTVVIRNNTLKIGSSSAGSVSGLSVSNASPAFYNNVIYGGTAPVGRSLCVALSYSAAPYLYNNTLIVGQGGGAHWAFQARLDGGGSCYPTLKNNLFIDLTSDSGGTQGLYHMDSGSGHYPVCYTTNVFYATPVATGDGAYVYYSGGNGSNININNYATMQATTQSSGTQLLGYNDPLWRNIVNQNPLFVNPGSADYHLQAGSPAAAAGTNLSATIPAFDRDGNPRTVPWSIGAYERD